MEVWVYLIWWAAGSLKDLHTWADPCQGTQCGDERQVGFFPASSQIPRLKVDVSRGAKHRLSANAVQLFLTFLGPVTFHGLGKNYIGNYWWAPLQTVSVSGAAGQRRRSAPIGIVILAVARMVIWTTQKKGLYDDANLSHRDLILFFWYQLRVKIRCNRKRLDRIRFDKRLVNAVSLVIRKGAMLESSFPPLPPHSVCGPGPSGSHLVEVDFFSFEYLVSGELWVIIPFT